MASATSGRTTVEMMYPAMTKGLRELHRSESLPETIFRTLFSASAAPSITPIAIAVPPSVRVR